MSKLDQLINIEEIIDEVSKMHMTVLRHAAEISPFVDGRTLGPDKELWQDAKEKRDDEEKEKSANNQKICNKTNKSPKSSQKNETKKNVEIAPPTGNGSLQYLDFQIINSSVLLREAEQQRKRTIRQQVIDMQERQLAIMREKVTANDEKQKETCPKWLERKRRSDSKILQEAEQQTIKELQEHERQLAALRTQTQRQLQYVSFQGVAQYQTKFRSKYEMIANLLMSIDKQALISCADYNRRLKELIQMFEQLIGKIKTGDCGASELKTAEKLCSSLDGLEASIIGELENILKTKQLKAEEAAKVAESNKLEEKRQQQEQQQHQSQQQQQQQQLQHQQQLQQSEQNEKSTTAATGTTEMTSENTQSPTVTNNTETSGGPSSTTEFSSQYVSSERYQFYTRINTLYQEKVDRVKALQADESMKKYRFSCQKSINIPVNAISAVSPDHLQDKFDKLFSFIGEQPPLGRDYCLLLMAKKFVSQGDSAISSNPQAAFPVASVIVSLWKLVPEFGQLFLAYVFKDSPFLVPYFIPQKRGQAVEDYYKVLGYRINDGQLEQHDMYLKRQAGIARLYGAVMITRGRKADGPSHPYGVEHAWRWLTNFVNLDPLPDICATLIMEILQLVGAELWSTYGKQFVKLLVYIQQHYFPKLSAVDEGGPKARLELLLGKFLREGQIPKPQGMLPVDFW